MDRIEEIRARLEKITPGPWVWDEPGSWHGLEARVFVPDPYGVVAQIPIEAWRPRSIGRANAAFIAAAPEDVSFLLSQLERARLIVERVRTIAPACMDAGGVALQKIVPEIAAFLNQK